MLRASTEHMADLARRLKSNDASLRLQAQEDLRVLIAAEVRRLGQIRVATRGVGVVYPVWVMYWMATNDHRMDDYAPVIIGGFFGVLYFFALVQSRVARPLIAIDLPQTVEPLIDVLATSSVSRQRGVKSALIRLLPRLQSSDATLLLPRHRKYLNQCLYHDEYWPYYGRLYGPDLKITILRALEQVGDATSLPAVEKLAKSARNPEVRTAAQNSLPFLQPRTNQVRAEQTLLRASEPEAPPEVLLRPASNGEETDPQQLLRTSTLDKP